MSVAFVTILFTLIIIGGACFNIFIETFRSEISDYIKACSEAKRNKNKRFEAIERALKEWSAKHANAD